MRRDFSGKTEVNRVPVYFEHIRQLPEILSPGGYSSIHILTDTNTSRECMPRLANLDWPAPMQEIVISEGEESKHLGTCENVWRTLAEQGADRRSLMLNLGGGVVTDLGGFCASTFMRGMAFGQLPTSVLGMADAAIGGKNGVDLDTLKNYVGLFAAPEFVWIDAEFIATLPLRHVRNGVAEIIKHGCIGNTKLLDVFEQSESLNTLDWNEVLLNSVLVKKHFVEKDPREQSIRATLNFGHTIGHAFETFGLQRDLDLLHGEAIALGMVVESAISTEQTGFPADQLLRIRTLISDIYPDLVVPDIPARHLEELIAKDKKRRSGQVHFVLLRALGSPIIDQKVPNDLIQKAVSDYK